MNIQFQQLPIGARFEFRGRRFEKLALSMAGGEDRCATIFRDDTEVFWDRRPGEEPRPVRPPPPPHRTAPSPINRMPPEQRDRYLSAYTRVPAAA
jgi:hypothetical protein